MAAPTDPHSLDAHAVRRAFDAASSTFDAAAGVHAEIRTRLLERLDVVRLAPKVAVDLGAATGHASRSLKQRYKSAAVLAVDFSFPMLQQALRQRGFLRRFSLLAADARALPLRNESVDLVFSNLLLQWVNEPDEIFQEVQRVLRPEGLFTFASLGPDTLRELRAAWHSVDAWPRVHRFIDMHDWGDALVRAGFADPVMDTERLTVTYAAVDDLMRELRNSGSQNAATGRARGLLTQRRLQALRAASAKVGQSRLHASVEVVYGHAWKVPAVAGRAREGEAVFPIAQLRQRDR
jgi:malonyl-CoA O-methyltransferase